ncbi:MAG: C25 family cysteine peptidase, partial [Bacteroidota bacterium]
HSNVSISYAKLKYARETDQSSEIFKEFDLQVKGSGGNVIEFLNTTSESKVYDITDPVNVGLITDTDAVSNTITCGFEDATQNRKLVVGSANTNFKLEKVGKFREINPADHNYIIISHKSLMQPAGGASDAVRAYAGYRNSAEGGEYDTLIVDIDQLYNQFSYGEVTPVAIYNFMEYMVKLGNPRFLFIIGKGLDVSFKYHRSDPAAFTYHDLVPTAGSPGSDLPYTAGLDGTTYENSVPTGRLSASSPQEVVDYLNKVIEMESTPYDQLWRKDILHLSGGNSLDEIDDFKSYVRGFEAIAEDYYFGGNVSTVSKSTTAPDEFINVSEEISNGLNLITFFGHSSSTVIDIDIGDPSDHNNQGKYPLILMNGCNTGNIFSKTLTFSDDWVLAPNKGAFAVIAHTSYGFPGLLKSWTDNFYNLAYGDTVYINKSIGEIQKETSRKELENVTDPPNTLIAQVQQMALQGDPAIKLFDTSLPDYEFKSEYVEEVSFTNGPITSSSDSFALSITVPNYGAYVPDSLEVFIERSLVDGTVLDSLTIKFSPVRYMDTLLFTLNHVPNSAGINRFYIKLDPGGKIEELDENNNEGYFSFTIRSAGTINLLPLDFSIQSEQALDFMVQSGNLLDGTRGYTLELDSTFLFSGEYTKRPPDKLEAQPVTWGLSILSLDSIAYYWRSRYAVPQGNETDEWSNSSFTYITGAPEGWAQVEYHQMINNKLDGLVANEGARTFDFKTVELPIEVKVHGANYTVDAYQHTELLIDGLPFIYPGSFTMCGNNQLHIVAFSQKNAAPYAPVYGIQIDPWTCGRSPQVINSYPAGKTLDGILDSIASGEKVLIFTTGSFDFNSLTSSQITKLEELGADATVLSAKQPNEPYILVGHKGAGASNAIAEIIADPGSSTPIDEQTISYAGDVVGTSESGKMVSPYIGPANSWDTLYLRMKPGNSGDSHYLNIYGKGFDGVEHPLKSNILDAVTNLASIPNVNNYPYLKLEINVSDTVNRTAPKLDKWLVTYGVPPEGIISYLDNSKGTMPVTLEEGDSLTTRFIFRNISDKDFMDSLTVRYSIINHDQNIKTPPVEFLIPPLASNTSDTIPITIDTKGFVGRNSMEVFVNPFIVPEQIYKNNQIILQDYFTVTKDATNPLLNVTFDGEYIFDGDIVSPNPHIRIEVDDDNEYLLKSDTLGVDIFLKKPCEGCLAERVSLAGNEITWSAETETEAFIVNYTPQNLEDGMYELSVQAEDASGNKSGAEPYKIHFEVINKSTVTNFYPYPNPFSSSVRFVFTLTGNEIPDEIMIRIFTVSGRVVREITQDELGLLRIGNNITDYAWDGRDEFGDQLANGVYLYKVYIRIDSEDVEFRQSAGDRGFEKGYGKLYLLR